MVMFSEYLRFGGMVDGLGEEEIPWWIAPYVRDFAGLAKSSALVDAQRNAAQVQRPLTSLAQRLAQTAAVARVAAHVKGNESLTAAVGAALAADIDEFCGTPPRPHHVNQAGLVLAVLAAGIEAGDPAKLALVTQAERLQGLRGQLAAAA